MPHSNTLDIRFLAAIDDIDAVLWNALTGTEYPFISWEFLFALEQSGAVSSQTGWQPHHIVIFQDETLLALMPMYLKSHSQGEYVFDHSWADAYARNGLNYYPKFVTAIPFTPCQGQRFCFHTNLSDYGVSEKELVQSVLNQLKTLSVQHDISSWHCLFPEKDDVINFASASESVLLRETVQFQWKNRDYTDFDDYLKTFTSKHRKTIRRERRYVEEQGISVSQLRGDQITEKDWQHFFKFYQATYWKRGMPEYLNLDFFLLLSKYMSNNCLLMIAQKGGQIVAGALSIIGEHTLYGRYWGCLEEYHSLHFELCYYQGLEFCIDNKLQCFNSGAQGEHKISRGFEPVKTYSLHWIADARFQQAIDHFLQEEKQHIDVYQEQASGLLPFKSDLVIDA